MYVARLRSFECHVDGCDAVTEHREIQGSNICRDGDIDIVWVDGRPFVYDLHVFGRGDGLTGSQQPQQNCQTTKRTDLRLSHDSDAVVDRQDVARYVLGALPEA